MTDKFEDCRDCAHRRKPIERRQFFCNRCESGEQFEDIEHLAMNPERDFRFEAPRDWFDDCEE